MRAGRGFSLGEVLVAGALLALLVMVVVNLLPTTVVALRQSSQRQQAYTLTQDALEAAAARPFNSLATGALNLEEIQVPTPFQMEVVISEVTGYPAAHLKRASARATWTTRTGEQSLTQEAYLHPARP